METEKMQFNVFAKDGKPAELIIREGKAPDMLPIKAAVVHNISGTIGAPVEFLKRRKPVPNQIDINLCHVLVNRKNISIELVLNESDPYGKGSVIGKLEAHPKFIEFGINQGKSWTPNDLGQFFKMNRFFFVDVAENRSIVTELKNFNAKIDTVIEKQKGDKGDFKDNYSGVVSSNLPGTFQLKIPIFKGHNSDQIEVELYSSVNGRDILLQLVSPGANQLLDEICDSVIDDQITQIREIAPHIVIIEI
jgi:hypothetical protein